MRLRVKFVKKDYTRFLGHLDLMRYFQKTIRRAEIDVAYTAGFNPHQIMSFAAPLGLGVESKGEYMDIQVNSMISCQDVMERLNRAGIPELAVVSVTELPENAGNAMASVAAASYEVRFREDRAPGFDVETALEALLAKEQILQMKTTKKGEREVDLRPGIYRCVWKEDAFEMFLNASSSGNIKPVQVIEALFGEMGECLAENALLICRVDMFTNIGTEEHPKFVPLDEVKDESTI